MAIWIDNKGYYAPSTQNQSGYYPAAQDLNAAAIGTVQCQYYKGMSADLSNDIWWSGKNIRVPDALRPNNGLLATPYSNVCNNYKPPRSGKHHPITEGLAEVQSYCGDHGIPYISSRTNTDNPPTQGEIISIESVSALYNSVNDELHNRKLVQTENDVGINTAQNHRNDFIDHTLFTELNTYITNCYYALSGQVHYLSGQDTLLLSSSLPSLTTDNDGISSDTDQMRKDEIAEATDLNKLIKNITTVLGDCICYSDCNGYSVCYCYGNCNHY